jgi:putative hydrolase of the HAD superfamily
MMRAVIFDLGGTLIHYDTPAADMRALSVMSLRNVYRGLAEQGRVLPPPDEFVRDLLGYVWAAVERDGANDLDCRSIDGYLRERLAALGVTFAGDAEWQVLRRLYYDPMENLIELRSHARATLATLRDNGYRLGVLSNTLWASDLHDRHLARYGLLEFFNTRVYSCDFGKQKPHPEVFRHACAQLGVEPRDAAYVGDRVREDVRGPQGIGMRAVLIRVPFRAETLDGVRPDAVIGELDELPSALHQLHSVGGFDA